MATSAYTGNPNIAKQGARARQIAQARNVSDIADPRTYGFMQGLLGSAPDQLGYSVFDDPETRRAAQQAAEVGLVGGGLLQGLPVIGPAVKGYGRLLGSEINRAMLGEGGLLGPITPQPMYVVPPGKSVNPLNLNKGIYKPELTMEEMLKVKDIPTVDRVKQSIDLVGEKEFEKMVNAQYKKYKPSDQDQEAMLVESVTLNILGRAQRSPYPQQAALDLAQQRAALPVEQGGLGLPVSNTPEMRAQAMGFDVPAYHGTQSDVQIFDLNKNITARDIYSSPNPLEASNYATNDGGNVMPLLLRGGVKDLTKESQYVDNQLKKAYNAQVSKYERKYYPFEEFKDSFMRGQLYQDTGGQSAQNALVGELTGTKKSTLKIPDAVRGGNVGQSYVVQNPANIRSQFAAFDPFRKDVATATAMGVALPDLLAAEPTPQPQSSGLLYPFP